MRSSDQCCVAFVGANEQRELMVANKECCIHEVEYVCCTGKLKGYVSLLTVGVVKRCSCIEC